MIDFSAYTGWVIPDGVVTQVADAQGNVLWKAAPAGANVTITGDGVGSKGSAKGTTFARIIIDDVIYTAATTLVVPLGTAIICQAIQMGFAGDASISYNGQIVASSRASLWNDPLQYEYTAVGDVTIDLSIKDPSNAGYVAMGTIAITEL